MLRNWIYRGPVATGPWKGGFYIYQEEAASALAYAKDEATAKRICDAINAANNVSTVSSA